jgi:Mn-dependent DtxR family transcriptional regulator
MVNMNRGSMPLTLDELKILACLYDKKVIGSYHKRVNTIASMCHIRVKKGLKSTLRRLANQGYLNSHHGPAYSLTRDGWFEAERFLGIR